MKIRSKNSKLLKKITKISKAVSPVSTRGYLVNKKEALIQNYDDEFNRVKDPKNKAMNKKERPD